MVRDRHVDLYLEFHVVFTDGSQPGCIECCMFLFCNFHERITSCSISRPTEERLLNNATSRCSHHCNRQGRPFWSLV